MTRYFQQDSPRCERSSQDIKALRKRKEKYIGLPTVDWAIDILATNPLRLDRVARKQGLHSILGEMTAPAVISPFLPIQHFIFLCFSGILIRCLPTKKPNRLLT